MVQKPVKMLEIEVPGAFDSRTLGVTRIENELSSAKTIRSATNLVKRFIFRCFSILFDVSLMSWPWLRITVVAGLLMH